MKVSIVLFFVFIAMLRRCDTDKPAKPPPAPESVVFLDEETYVSSDAIRRFEFSVREPALVKLDLTIRNEAPLDVIVANGQFTEARYYASAMVLKPMEDAMNFLSSTPTKATNVFSSPLARQGAYQRFESPFARFEPGIYTVIVDNTPAFTATRGDAPVRLRLLPQPVAATP